MAEKKFYGPEPAKPMYMGIDQYGTYYHGLIHPRRDLLNRLDRKHADKMYCDRMDGRTLHVGYVIAGCWITLYKVESFEREA